MGILWGFTGSSEGVQRGLPQPTLRQPSGNPLETPSKPPLNIEQIQSESRTNLKDKLNFQSNYQTPGNFNRLIIFRVFGINKRAIH